LLILALGFLAGWAFRGKKYGDNNSCNANSNTTAIAEESPSLRLGGYNLINPLLLCDTSSDTNSPKLQVLGSKLNSLVEKEVRANYVASASIYFRDLKNGNQLVVNPNEKFHPASLGKIPIMIAYFKMAESDSTILQKKVTADFSTDMNAQQEIQSSDYVKNGQTYTIEELIEKLIQDSDNNALVMLSNNIDAKTLKGVYQDLRVPFLSGSANQQDPAKFDFMTPVDFSYFFRVLYNGTYLHKSYSEKALQILTGIDFKDGLAAGVPGGTTVVHKFGLETIAPNGLDVAERELHDCGIIYRDSSPYLLCVMTKSTSSLSAEENVIKDISALVYQEADNNYQ